MRSKWLVTASVVTLCLLALSCTAAGTDLDEIEQKVLDRDTRNSAVDFNLVAQDKRLTFSVEGANGAMSNMDVFRVVSQSAEALKNENFDEVIFAFRSTPRFKVNGEDFRTLGKEYGVQNAAYVIRTWPSKLLALDGKPAYESHRGGLLYVVGEQMEDFGDWHHAWYLDELIAENKAEIEKLQPKTYADDDAF